MIDETRIERALREGPPFRTRYVPGSLSSAPGTALRPAPLRASWVLVAVVLMLGLLAGGGALVGSGIVKLPVLTQNSAAPSPTPEGPSPAATPVATLDPDDASAWVATGNMLTPRSMHTATLLLNGTVLVAGGLAGSEESLASAEIYDPATGTWTATGEMADARAVHSAIRLPDGRVLVAGGTPSNSSARYLASAELYDPVTGTWTATQDMALERINHTATLLADGRVLVAGGAESKDGQIVAPFRYNRLTSAELYDPVTGTWTATGHMTRARDAHSATLLPDGRVLVAGGADRDRLGAAELYDPATGTWTGTGNLPEPYGGHTAMLLPNGTVLVAGGDAPSGPGARGWPHAAIYDPVTEMWAAVGDMITAPLGHTATLLPDGRVLVSGGRVHGGLESANFDVVEVYDLVTGRWTATASMAAARSGHTATLLPDGRVLVSGGDQLSSAELYDPDGGT